MNLLQFCEILPKVELHAHLNGSLSKKTLLTLGVPEEHLIRYQLLDTIINKNEALNEAFKLFKVAHGATTTLENVFLATQHVIEEFHEDNVIYLELRTTPRQENNMTKEEYIEAVVRAIENNTKSIVVKLIISIDRTHDLDKSLEVLYLIIKMRDKYPNIIKGIELSGNPNQGSFCEEIFIKARKKGLKVTLHCGEVQNDEEVSKILKFKPDRIGHATFLHPNNGGSQDVWELYTKFPIPTECCLTSNILCGTSQSYQKHHLKEWINNKLPFSLNTDDKGVFNTCLSREYFLAAESFNISRKSLLECALASVDQSFALLEEKLELKSYLGSWYQENQPLFN